MPAKPASSTSTPAAEKASPVKPVSALQILLRIPLKGLLDSLSELSTQIGDPKAAARTGGSLLIAVFDPIADVCSEITVSFGKPNPETLGRSVFHVGKKFYALRKIHLQGTKDVICTSQIAHVADQTNTDINLYPGCMAFFYPDGTIVYIGISGWKAEVDETGAYYVAKHLGLPLPANYRNVLNSDALNAFELGELIFDTHFEGVKSPLPAESVPPFDAEYEAWQMGLMHAAAENL